MVEGDQVDNDCDGLIDEEDCLDEAGLYFWLVLIWVFGPHVVLNTLFLTKKQNKGKAFQIVSVNPTSALPVCVYSNQPIDSEKGMLDQIDHDMT